MFGICVQHSADERHRHSGVVDPLEPPGRETEQHHAEVGRVRELLGVVEHLVKRGRPEGRRIRQQHAVHALLLRQRECVDVLLERVERGVEEQLEVRPARFAGDRGHARVLLRSDVHLGDQKRARVAELLELEDVVSDRVLVDPREVRRIRGQGHRDGAVPMLLLPTRGLRSWCSRPWDSSSLLACCHNADGQLGADAALPREIDQGLRHDDVLQSGAG